MKSWRQSNHFVIYRLHQSNGLVPVKSSATASGNQRAGVCFPSRAFRFRDMHEMGYARPPLSVFVCGLLGCGRRQ